jgi:nitrite reductase/ring-hydroxylating ferredoxin subunit
MAHWSQSAICSVLEIADPGAREFSVGAGEWPLRGFVVRYQNQVHAYVNSCPHARMPLNFKPHEFFAPDVQLLQCVAHGALFEPRTGECVAGPCVGRRLRELDVEIIDGYIYLRSHPDALANYWA